MSQSDTVTVEEEEQWVELDQARIVTKTWMPENGNCEAPPILLLHDSLGCVALWRSFPSRLASATGRRVVAYDRIGFGRSDAHPGKLGLAFIQEEARLVVPQVLAHLKISKFIVCGHSVGGGMAIETAAWLQNSVSAVVTISAQAFVEARTIEGVTSAERDMRSPEIRAKLARSHGDKAEWVVDAWTKTWLAPEFRNWSLDATLAEIKCPVLAIHGDRDEYGSLEHPKRISEDRGRVHIMADVGHVPHREDEKRLVDVIKRFVSEVDQD
jgi:pimeloyl-ACP methyl ester carboxylesterase